MAITNLPTYFIGHGGVNILDKSNRLLDSYRAQLKDIGEEILKLKPKGIIATSGHFESPYTDKIRINTKEDTGVLYDYFFKQKNPAFYQLKFEHRGSTVLANEIKQKLISDEIDVEEVQFDTDHGIWVPNKLLFSEDKLEIPVISVSTYKPLKFEDQVRLGKSLSQLRNEGYIIINYGMAVHNVYYSARDDPTRIAAPLRDDSYDVNKKISNPKFAEDFTSELDSIVSLTSNANRLRETIKLQDDQESNLSQAHPTLEHFTPFLVFVGSGLDTDEGYVYPRTRIANGMSFSNYKLSN